MQDALSLVKSKEGSSGVDNSAVVDIGFKRCWPEVDRLPLNVLKKRARQHPGRAYLKQPIEGRVKTYTWGQVYDQAARIANYLRTLGLKPGSRVGILGKNCAHWIITDYAIWLAGCVSVPLYPTLSGEGISTILRHADVKVLFVGKLDCWDRSVVFQGIVCVGLPLCSDGGLIQWQSIIEKYQPIAQVPTSSPDQLATIIYTSGTTGGAKGVMHSFGTLAAAAGHASKIYRVNDSDRVLSYLPLSHVAERLVVELASLYEGFTVFFSEGLSTFTKDLARARPTIFFAVPRIWAKFQEAVADRFPSPLLMDALLCAPGLNVIFRKAILKKLGLHKVRLALSGAAPLAEHLLKWYQKIGLEILEVYGMTENMGYSHSTREHDQRFGYVGLPNPGVMVKLNEAGEVLVASNTTMIGYFHEPELTKEAFEDGYLKTGDLGELDQSGRLKITGRSKDIFKTSKGKYVCPGPLEAQLSKYTEIDQVCVLGEGLSQPLALMTLSVSGIELLKMNKESFIAKLGILRKQTNELFERHEAISHWVVTLDPWTSEAGFLTPTLKIKRHFVESKYKDNLSEWTGCSDPVLIYESE